MSAAGFERRLALLAAPDQHGLLAGGLKGIEKESLRIDGEGRISQRPHPPALGSALTSRFITTDYSEALLEFVTPPLAQSWETLQFLCDIHQFVYQRLDEELLWATSMPCAVGTDEDIPIAAYGSSNVGMMKHVYRRGLAYRYGRVMQTIAGVHFNYSLPESFWSRYGDLLGSRSPMQQFRSAAYFDVLRNFRRIGWLLLYLFGASPAICKSFARGRVEMSEFDYGTLYEPYATSLRMSDLGYKNKQQAGLAISVNGLDQYITDLTRAVTTPEPDYERLGVLVDGEYRQLNTNLLQIENEYYSLIRPKRVAQSGERPTAALRRGGVQYVEVRALDVSVFDPAGINQNELRFVEALLIYCMLEDSPPIDAGEQQSIDSNQGRVARRGREPGLQLQRADGQIGLRDWAREILDRMAGVCELLDVGGEDYRLAWQAQRDAVEDADLTPSARVLEEMRSQRETFFAFAMRMSETHRSYFDALQSPNAARLAELENEAQQSLERQLEIERNDRQSFEDYRREYFAAQL